MVHTVPIRNSRGELELVLEFAVDISEVARLREELRATQDRLTSLGLMVGSVSHGVKGILTGMDAGVYLAESGLRKQNPEQTREGLETVKQMVERIRRVVLDVLYFAKERPLSRKRLAVSTVAQSLMALASPRVQKHSIELVTAEDAALGWFEADDAVLTPALNNIFENAVDACLADRDKTAHRVTFSVGSRPDHVVFEIADNGVGMSPETQRNIFDLFYSSKGQEGTGLGLFITRQVIEQHGGKLEVESEPGVGTVFRVRLPRMLPRAESEPLPDAPPD
jgi:signal transduction histidine kinase